MNLKQAHKICTQLINQEVKRISFNANLHDKMNVREVATIAASKRRKQLLAAREAINANAA